MSTNGVDDSTSSTVNSIWSPANGLPALIAPVCSDDLRDVVPISSALCFVRYLRFPSGNPRKPLQGAANAPGGCLSPYGHSPVAGRCFAPTRRDQPAWHGPGVGTIEALQADAQNTKMSRPPKTIEAQLACQSEKANHEIQRDSTNPFARRSMNGSPGTARASFAPCWHEAPGVLTDETGLLLLLSSVL